MEPPISKKYVGRKILVALLADCPIFWEPSRGPHQSPGALALVMQSGTPSERRVLVKSRVGEIKQERPLVND